MADDCICTPDTLAARTLAMFDDSKATDTSHQITDDDAAIQYAAMGASLADERNKNLYARIGIKNELKNPSPYPQNLYGASQQLLRGFTDWDVRPNEILGNEIVYPVMKAEKDYRTALTDFVKENPDLYKNRDKNPETWEEETKQIAIDSGYAEAKRQALRDIKDFYGDGINPEKEKYGNTWLNQYMPNDSWEFIKNLTGNVIENVTKNSVMLTYRHIFDNLRTIEAFDAQSWLAGREDYKNASPEELNSLQIRGRYYEDATPESLWTKLKDADMLHKVANRNQAETYFAAKAFAMKHGLGEEQAREYGQYAAQNLQFRTSAVNAPRAFWRNQIGGKGLMGLMKYQIMERRWVQTIAKNAIDGWNNRTNPEGQQLLKQSMGTLIKFGLVKSVIFGASATLPAETDYLEMFNPQSEDFLAHIDKWSLSGMLGVDLGKYSRVPLTPVGMVGRMGLFFTNMQKAGEQMSRLLQHPESGKQWVKAFAGAANFAPSIPVLGNSNAARIIQGIYDQDTGNYTHRTARGQQYETSPQEEWKDILLRSGHQSIDRRIQKLDLEQGK